MGERLECGKKNAELGSGHGDMEHLHGVCMESSMRRDKSYTALAVALLNYYCQDLWQVQSTIPSEPLARNLKN